MKASNSHLYGIDCFRWLQYIHVIQRLVSHHIPGLEQLTVHFLPLPIEWFPYVGPSLAAWAAYSARMVGPTLLHSMGCPYSHVRFRARPCQARDEGYPWDYEQVWPGGHERAPPNPCIGIRRLLDPWTAPLRTSPKCPPERHSQTLSITIKTIGSAPHFLQSVRKQVVCACEGVCVCGRPGSWWRSPIVVVDF